MQARACPNYQYHLDNWWELICQSKHDITLHGHNHIHVLSWEKQCSQKGCKVWSHSLCAKIVTFCYSATTVVADLSGSPEMTTYMKNIKVCVILIQKTVHFNNKSHRSSFKSSSLTIPQISSRLHFQPVPVLQWPLYLLLFTMQWIQDMFWWKWWDELL